MAELFMNQDDAICTMCGRQVWEGEECYDDPVAGCVCEDCMETLLEKRKCDVGTVIDRI